MDKQTLSEAISNAKKYAKNLKQQVSINNPLILSQNSISCELSYHELTYLHTNSVSFNKTKSKVESMNYFKEKSPPKMIEKSVSNITSKMSIVKKQVQSESQRENNFQKSQNRMQSKYLNNLFAGSLGSKQLINKKNGHNHTYTHLNDLHSDKFSEIESNISTKTKINRLRHSKSPNKQRHVELNFTTQAEQIYKTKSVHYSQSPQRSKSEIKQNRLDVSKLMEQINRLQEIIKKYKSLIIQMKIKYKEMQLKLDEKVMNDHFIDTLKFQIQELQDKNNELNVVISKQNEKINSFQLIMIEKIKKVNEYYSNYIKDRIQLQKQNEVLKNLLLIAIQNKNTIFATNKGSQVEKQLQNNIALQVIAKSAQKFSQKWS